MNDLSESRARIAELETQIRFLQQGDGSSELLAQRQAMIASLQSELQTLRAYYDQLGLQHQALIEKMSAGGAGGGTGLPVGVVNLLRELQANYSEYFTYDEKEGRLRFASDLTFALGSATVSEKAKEALAKLAEILKQEAARDVIVSVYGHTDDVPVRRPETVRLFRDNQGLSEARARAVSDVLGGQGIAGSRITTKGFGQTQPISTTDKARNRRVEIYLTMTR